MALHFEKSEFDARRDRLTIEMAEKKLDAMLLFAQESMYWLTGYDTFGFCFFQCLVVKADGSMVLLTRSADLRQARHTSTIENIVVWTDRADANPAIDLRNLLNDLDLLGMRRIGVEYDTHGLTAYQRTRRLDEQLQTFGQIADRLRHRRPAAPVQEPGRDQAKAEKAAAHWRRRARRGTAADQAGRRRRRHPGGHAGRVFAGGGDYPANEFIIGSGADALLCRYKAGRRKLTKNDQLTLEWAGVFHHYHAPMMRTVLTGKVSKRHQELFDASRDALVAVEKAMVPGKTFGDVFDAHARVMEAARADQVTGSMPAVIRSAPASPRPGWTCRCSIRAIPSRSPPT